MKKINNVQIFEEENIITLFADDGTPIEFYELASVDYNDKFYELVQPVELNDEISEDEAVVFEFVPSTDGEGTYTPVFDEALLGEIFEEYMRAVADLDDECGCGSCDDDDCECGCGDDNCECGCGSCGDNCDCDDDKCDCEKEDESKN